MKSLAIGVAAATLWVGSAAAQMPSAQSTPAQSTPAQSTPGAGGFTQGGAALPAPGSAVAIPDVPSLRPRTPPMNPTAGAQGAGTPGMDQGATAEPPQPAHGRNTYTRSQATYRIASQGYQDVSGLRLGRDGVWRGQAMKDGQAVKVWLDHTGAVGVEQPPVPPAEPANAPGAEGTPGSGTPGSGTPGSGTPGSGTPGSGTPGSGSPGAGGAASGGGGTSSGAGKAAPPQHHR